MDAQGHRPLYVVRSQTNSGTPRGGQFKDWISAISLSTDESHLAAADIGGHVAIWKL